MTTEASTGPLTAPGPEAAAPATKRHRWLWGAVLVCAILAGVWFWRSRKQPAPTTAGANGAADVRPIPVNVETVTPRDIPIYLDGLGSAVPLVTVTVKPQIDGRLDSVRFREGQEVHKGDLLAEIDPRPFLAQLHQAQATLARDVSQVKNAELKLGRYVAEQASGLIPKEQLDDQKALYDQFGATVQSDRAALETTQLQLDYTRVRSPADGITGIRLVDAGNIVHAADPNGIVVVTQLDPMAIVFTLPEDALLSVNKRLSQAALAVEVYSRDGASKLGAGTLAVIDNQINQTTATIRLKAVVPNPERALWPNEFVRVRLLLDTRPGAIAVSASAVQRGPQGTFVYIATPKQTAELRTIDVESVQDQWAIVTRGINAGDSVVTEGQSQLRPGAKLAVRPAARAGAARPEGSSGAARLGKSAAASQRAPGGKAL